MVSSIKSALCPEAAKLQEVGNELIGLENYDEAILGEWSTDPMQGFSNNQEQPTTILITPFPWLPKEDAERLVEVTGLEYPIFSLSTVAIRAAETLTIFRVSLGGTASRSLFENQGRCSIDISSRRSTGIWGTSTFMQDGMNSGAGVGYGSIDVLGLIEQIRQTAI